MCWAEIRLLTRVERLRLLLMLHTGFSRSHLASVLGISSSTRRFWPTQVCVTSHSIKLCLVLTCCLTCFSIKFMCPSAISLSIFLCFAWMLLGCPNERHSNTPKGHSIDICQTNGQRCYTGERKVGICLSRIDGEGFECVPQH